MKIVGYIRVSTKQQGQSGLGLDAQRAMIEAYAAQTGADIVEMFAEIETGTAKKSRPLLDAAIALATGLEAKLVVAKLDRLSRDVMFLFRLHQAKVNFVALDMPELNTLTLGIMASFAQYEAERISQRTKAALASAKERKQALGRKANLYGQAKGNEAWKSIAASRLKRELSYMPVIKSLKASGLTYEQIAQELAQMGVRQPDGKQLSKARICFLLRLASNG